jgi:glycosyltransferase involved in cell wall biosynthesis
MSKKVLVFSHEFPPFGGGAGVVAYQYCIEFEKLGYDVTLFTRHQDSFSSTLGNIEIITAPYIPKLWFFSYYLKLKRLNLKQFDTIVVNDIGAGFVAGKYFDISSLKKSVPILHGSEPEQIYTSPSILFKLMRFQSSYSKLLDYSKKIVAVSHYMKEKFLEETPFNKENKIEVVYAGLSKEFFIEDEVDCNEIFNYQNKEILLSVSRIEKEKGFLDKYEIFKKLILQDDSYIWIIIGDGKFKNEFENLVHQDKLEKKVIFKGKVPREKLYQYYKCADVFWLLSKYKESFGLVYLEAQVYGCPVIGLNKYGVKESIESGVSGFLVDSVDESFNILKSKKYLELKKENILNFSKKFSLNNQTILNDNN